MAITDINISEQLETSAPSIKYEGNEGPKSPQEQQQMMMAQLEQEYNKYVFEMQEQGIEPMSLQQFIEQAMAEGQMSSAQPMPNRQMAAYGGIMGLDGRKRYGIGSWLKEKARKLIPNELATAARVAAPFVAPFNPLIGGAMAGLGGFDKHGSISRGLKSGLMTYGLGQGARYLGGAGPQWGLQTSGATAGGGLGNYFSKPTGTQTGLGKWFGGDKGVTEKATKTISDSGGKFTEVAKGTLSDPLEKLNFIEKTTETGKNLGKISEFINKNSTAILLGSMGLAYATAKPEDVQEAMKMSRGTGLDIDKIRAEVQEALAGGEEAWALLQKKYPYIGEYDTKIGAAEGGRIGYYAGGQSTPSDYTMEDARKTSMQDKMGGITEIMKQADLSRKGDVGQMYAAEGGLMDLGGMEKDYRQEGGFVPLGGKEKADDVPARLSKNEFVFTADAVRGAGDGDIDKGAEIMENIMKNLEQGGQISEETQGLSGAREMFDVSERLSEVV